MMGRFSIQPRMELSTRGARKASVLLPGDVVGAITKGRSKKRGRRGKNKKRKGRYKKGIIVKRSKRGRKGRKHAKHN